jgi:hypothetical protein
MPLFFFIANLTIKKLEIGTFILSAGILDIVVEVISKQSQIQVLKAANAEPSTCRLSWFWFRPPVN